MAASSDPVALWQWWFSLISVGAIALMLVSVIILRLTLDRRVRKALPADKVYNCPLDWYGGFIRSMVFSLASLSDRPKRYAMKDYYDGFDVKAFANRFEKTTAWIYVTSFSTLSACTLFYLITKFLGLVEWPSSVS